MASVKGKERREREKSKRQHEKRHEEPSNSRAFYLDILDLHSEATPDEIRKKYRELVKVAHPDHGGNAHHFRIIRKAYESLMDE